MNIYLLKPKEDLPNNCEYSSYYMTHCYVIAANNPEEARQHAVQEEKEFGEPNLFADENIIECLFLGYVSPQQQAGMIYTTAGTG